MKKLTQADFVKRSMDLHRGWYDYSKSFYEKNDKKVDIICKVHGVFSQKAANHLNGQGCPYCSKKNRDRYIIYAPDHVGDKKIPLTNGGYTVVDSEDYNSLVKISWRRCESGYAKATINDKNVRMHRLIMGVEDKNTYVDHANNNKLDNRRLNLRICNNSQNMANRAPTKGCKSKYKGVTRSKGGVNWEASISCNKTRVHLGTFSSELDAAKHYDEAAKNLFGRFARTNF